MKSNGRKLAPLVPLLLAAALPACRQKMADQPSVRPLDGSTFFEDGRASRPVIEGTVARGHLNDDELLETGMIGGDFSDVFPRPVTRAMLDRGRERFDIFCSPCHDRLGQGNGMVVQRGYPQPPSLHIDRLRQAKPGYLYDVIRRGFGRMPAYGPQVPVEDRWAIVAYIRALQLSEAAGIEDVPRQDRSLLDAPASAPSGEETAPAGAVPAGASGEETGMGTHR